MPAPKPEPALPLDLGDGLILRRGTASDSDTLPEFNAAIHADLGPQYPDQRVGAWTRDLLTETHPTFRPADFTIVEVKSSGKIVSSCNLISQTWTYDGAPFGVGRPELVGTLPEYRRRGLVRIQFDVLHAWSRQRGELVQVITGIPNYYRQFGYEMALNLDSGRFGYHTHLPRLAEDESERVAFRKVEKTDPAWMAELYNRNTARYPLACRWNATMMAYEVWGKSAENVNRLELRVIESAGGETLGFIGYPDFLWDTIQAVSLYELKPGVSWWSVTPAVARYVWSVGQANAKAAGKELESFGFWLGDEHPAYQSLPGRLPRVRRPSYAWYLRVPEMPAFLRAIAPALEKRLSNSICVGYSGELKISFYRGGVKLKFDAGKLVSAEDWEEKPDDDAVAAFPDLTFLQLLFGYRSLDELRFAFADCLVNEDKARPLLEALFPKAPSNVWPIS